MVDLVRSRRDAILSAAERHGVTRVRMFGSMARATPALRAISISSWTLGRTPVRGFRGGS
jgi:hypothetical protein